MARIQKKTTAQVRRAQAPKTAPKAEVQANKPERAAAMTTERVRQDGALPQGEQVHTGAAVSVRNMVLTEKDLSQLRPGVAELYTTYGIKERLGRPRERFLTWTAYAQGVLGQGKDASSLADVLVSKDLRRQIFLLEGLLKLYDGEYPGLKPHFETIKRLEDVIGAHTGALALQKSAGALEGLPPKVAHYIDEQVASTRKDLEHVIAHGHTKAETKDEDGNKLPDQGWLVGDDGKVPVFASLIKELEGTQWATSKEDRKWIKGEIKEKLDEIDDTKYDMADLQGEVGMHEFRRDIRWLPIYAEALDGLFVLDNTKNPSKHYEKLLITDANDPDFVTDLSTSKFVRLPAADLEKKPINFSLSLYTANMKGVLDFGKLKDRGEAIENLAHALVHAGEAKDLEAAMPVAMDLMAMPRDTFETIVDEAKVLYKEWRKEDLTDLLEDELK